MPDRHRLPRFVAALSALCLAGCGGSVPGAQGPPPPTPEILRAQRSFVQGDFSGAARQLEKITAADPDNFHAWYRLGVVQMETDPDRGLESLDRAMSLDPGHPGPHMFRGFSLLASRDFGGADEAFARGYALSRARTGYALADTSDAIARALGRLDLGQPLDALPLFEAEAESAQDDGVLWLLAAEAAVRSGRGDAALSHAERAVSLLPESAAAHAYLAGALFQDKRFEEARAETDRALELRPDLPFALYMSGRLLLEESEYTAAFTTIWSAVFEDPARPDFYHEMGTQMIKLGLADQGTPVLQYMDWVTAFLGRHLARPGRAPER